MKSSKVKCKVLHLGSDNARHRYRLGGEVIQSSPGDKTLGVMADHESTVSAHSPKSQMCPGLQPKESGQQDKGSYSPPLICSSETPPGVQFWSPQHKDMEMLEEVQRRPQGDFKNNFNSEISLIFRTIASLSIFRNFQLNYFEINYFM
ncbi:hypothetical protein HGM15179_014504 [Zosterops borbonicus]|uniref:Uncharacterized protein n=1 Tax=Zosterops borbonicus TaxID=364589 RepID=A0A8K1G6C8_9PASS|nr:hypothetical protein HGM15179_014504 [Zosterops borbonicus]